MNNLSSCGDCFGYCGREIIVALFLGYAMKIGHQQIRLEKKRIKSPTKD